jgi:hypothetical protein
MPLKTQQHMIGPSVSVQRVVRCQHANRWSARRPQLAGARRWLCATGFAATVLPLTQLQGQIIRGKVVEFRSDMPVDGAQITLLDSKKRELDVGTRTDSVGAFTLRAPGPGRYIVRARRFGYDEFLSIPKDVKATDTVRVNLWPEANGQLLDSILSLDSRSPTVRGTAFAARQRAGHGQFIDRRKIAKEDYRDLEEALTLSVPGLDIRRRQFQGAAMCNRGCCSFAIYHDGLPTTIADNARAAGPQLEIALSTRGTNLHGVELYAGRSEIPSEYRDAARGFCGVLAYWTHSPD